MHQIPTQLKAFFVIQAVMLSSAAAAVPPKPWNPLLVNGDSVVATDKQIDLGPDGLPTQMKVGATSLLAQPIQMWIDGRPVTTQPQDAKRTLSADADQYSVTRSIVLQQQNSSTTCAITTRIEFDALQRFDLSCPQMTALSSMPSITWTIRFGAGAVRFLHRWGDVGERNFDLEQRSESTVAMSFVPFFWLGDDSRGLYWLCESSSGWANADRNDAIQLRREGAAWAVTITVKPQPATDGSWAYDFALMPTPVKSLPAHWRKWRIYPARNATVMVVWPNEEPAQMTLFGYPRSDTPEKLIDYAGNLRRAGMVAAPYTTPTWLFTKHPEWASHASEWSSGVKDQDFKEPGAQFVHVCANKPSWHSFIDPAYRDFIQRLHLQAIYLDNSQIYQTQHCLSDDERSTDAQYVILGQRPVFQEIERDLQANTAEPLSIVHSSGGINAPSYSVADAWVNGEQYRGRVKDDYLRVATLTDFRVEANGRQWGFVPIFLPEFPAEVASAVAPTRKLMSILLLHDITPWPQWANVDEINRGLGLLDGFGVEDADFIPYYAPHPLASLDQPGLFVSAYRRGAEALLIVANLNEGAAASRMCLSPQLASAAVAVKSLPTREPVSLNAGCLQTDIPAGSYQMYVVSTEAAKVH